MSSDIKIKDQKMIFLDEMMDQVIILDKFKNVFLQIKALLLDLVMILLVKIFH